MFALQELIRSIPKNPEKCVIKPGDPNWGGPLLRHNGRSNVAFADSHVESLQARQWYWGDTPWLKPNEGGQ